MHSRTLTIALCLALAATTSSCSKNAGEYAASGDAYIAEGKLREAIVEYRSAIQADPQFGDARLKLAKAFESVGDSGNAMREFIRAADQLPSNVEAQLKAGAHLLQSGQFEDARSRADKVLAIDARNADAQILRASALASMKDLDGAIREMEQALEIDPAQPRMHSSLGVLEMAKGNQAEAEGSFRKAVTVDPKSLPAHLSLAAFLVSTQRSAEAEKVFLTAFEVDPKSQLTNRALAMFYLTTNRAPQAETYLKTLAEISQDGTGSVTLADYYVRMQRLADARNVLEGVSGNAALFSDVRRRIATILFAENKPAEAHRVIDEVLAKNAKDAQALLLRGRLERLEGKSAEAMISVQAAISANPNLMPAHYLLGELYVQRGQTEQAIAAFNDVLRLNPRVAGAQIELARLNLSKSGGVDSSVDYARQALTNQPGNPNAQLVLVRGLLVKGDLTRANVELQALIKRFPNAAPVQSLMGSMHVLRKDPGGARQYYERALQLDPNFVEPVAGLVTLDLSARRFDTAKSRVAAELQRRPTHTGLLELGARTAMSAGDMAGAEGYLRRLIETAPERLQAYGLLAQVYVGQKKLDEARAELQRMAAKQDKPVGAHTMIGMLYEQQGRQDEARKMYEQVLAYDSGAAVAANNLAWMMAERHENLDLALKYAQTAKAALPDVAEVSDTLAWVYYKKDLATLAVAPLQHAIGKDPRNPTYHYRLGLVYLKTGDSAKARQSLQQALTINPNFAQAQDAKSRLAAL